MHNRCVPGTEFSPICQESSLVKEAEMELSHYPLHTRVTLLGKRGCYSYSLDALPNGICRGLEVFKSCSPGPLGF